MKCKRNRKIYAFLANNTLKMKTSIKWITPEKLNQIISVLLTLCFFVSVVFAYTGHIYQSNFYFMSIIFFPWE